MFSKTTTDFKTIEKHSDCEDIYFHKQLNLEQYVQDLNSNLSKHGFSVSKKPRFNFYCLKT